MNSSTTIDLLAVGEILVDFISTEPVASLREASTFMRHLGGSPANIAANVSQLGRSAALIAKTGVGTFGQFLKTELQSHSVDTQYMLMDPRVETSMIFVSRTSGTPDFKPIRDGDYKLTPEEISMEAVSAAKLVHFSTWPLSREPSRSAIRRLLQIAGEQGKIISFDPNYSPVVWPDHQEARKIIHDICQYVTITKASIDDAHRLFGGEHLPETYIQMLHELGPRTVVFTMGSRGSLISQDGHLLGHLPSRPIKVKDSTGAGDAFWAGFLVALLEGDRLERCLLFAREVAELKLQTIGVLPAVVDRDELYARLPDLSEAFNAGDFRS